MTAIAHDTALDLVREKVLAGERLDLDDGLALLESDDLLAIGELADLARRERGGDDRVFFIQNLYLYQTNVCRVKCKFCAFAATQKQAHAYTLTPDEFVAEAVAQQAARPRSPRSISSTARTRTSTSTTTSTRFAACTRRFRTCSSSATRPPRSTT